MKYIFLNLFADEHLVNKISQQIGGKVGKLVIRQFPDEETYVKIESDVKDANVIIVASLDRPNTKIIPLVFVANTAKDLGAKRVTILATYLAYMRQDKMFTQGEGVTSQYFASLLSLCVDELITVDPHLHRRKSLNEIYSINTVVISAVDKIAEWIKQHVESPIIIGPDQESEQWVSTVAQKANAPFTVLNKIRRGDDDVEISIPHIDQYQNCVPVLVDDIISTAKTMIETINQLKKLNMKYPICVAVHAIFSKNAYLNLLAAGAVKVITCNTIKHESNAIDLSGTIVKRLSFD